MKQKLQPKELRNKSNEELKGAIKTLEEEYAKIFGLIKQGEKHKDIGCIKRNIARIKTILRERAFLKDKIC